MRKPIQHEHFLPITAMGFTTAVAGSSAESCVCAASHSTEAELGVGGESRSDQDSALPWYLPSSIKGYGICAHFDLLQKI